MPEAKQVTLRPVLTAPDELPVRYVEIPKGEAGVRATLEVMGQLAKQQLSDGQRGARFVEWARAAVRDVDGKDYAGELRALFAFVKRNVTYRYDPRWLERVQGPYWTLCVDGAGDCDDMATLLVSLALALGHGGGFRAVAVDPGRPNSYSHVYALLGCRVPARDPDTGKLRIVTKWYAADATQKRRPLGWEPPAGRQTREPLDLIVAEP